MTFLLLFVAILFSRCSSTILQDGKIIESPAFPSAPQDFSGLGNVSLVFYFASNPLDVCHSETFAKSHPLNSGVDFSCVVVQGVSGREKCLPEQVGVVAADKGFSCLMYVNGWNRAGAVALMFWRYKNSPIPMFDISNSSARYIQENNISYASIENTPNFVGKGTATFNVLIFLSVVHGCGAVYLAYITYIRMVRNIKIGIWQGKPKIKITTAGYCSTILFIAALVRSKFSFPQFWTYIIFSYLCC
jgi:hypothetical protein